MTTAGGFTEYPMPTVDSHPYGVTAGPDGNMWFTEGSGQKVAKLVLNGRSGASQSPSSAPPPRVPAPRAIPVIVGPISLTFAPLAPAAGDWSVPPYGHQRPYTRLI